MILIIEGCDGSGKTTLALKLSEDLHGVYINTKIVPPRLHHLWGQMESLRYIQQHYSPFVIADRCHGISDQIYAPIIRQTVPDFSPSEARMAMGNSNVVIHCDPGTLAVMRNVEATSPTQMPGVYENTLALHNAYREYFRDNPPWREWNYVHHSYGELLNNIRERENGQ